MKIISFFLLILLYACGAKGEYCTTVPNYGECQDGYQKVSLEGGGKCMISQCGNSYANYGTWSKSEENITISNVQGDFSRYNGNYEWKEHNNARGIGKSGQVLKLKESGEIGIQLFPL
jgi:hypothetical protein